ncbi:MAG: hypothetical protein ABIF77_13875 [bacterium]
MNREEWGRRILATALHRVREQLSRDLYVEHCLVSWAGEYWTVRLECRPKQSGSRHTGLGLPATSSLGPLAPQRATGHCRRLIGHGTARLRAGWLPGDPRFGRQLLLALACALAEIAEISGGGLRTWRWFVPRSWPDQAGEGD